MRVIETLQFSLTTEVLHHAAPLSFFDSSPFAALTEGFFLLVPSYFLSLFCFCLTSFSSALLDSVYQSWKNKTRCRGGGGGGIVPPVLLIPASFFACKQLQRFSESPEETFPFCTVCFHVCYICSTPTGRLQAPPLRQGSSLRHVF